MTCYRTKKVDVTVHRDRGIVPCSLSFCPNGGRVRDRSGNNGGRGHSRYPILVAFVTFVLGHSTF